MDKLVVILNGKGGVGKDTLATSTFLDYPITIISVIDPVKKLAKEIGWDDYRKDLKSRKFLCDLKQLTDNYCDLSDNYIVEEYEKFKDSHYKVLFVHVREPEQIERLMNRFDLPHVSILVRRDTGIKSYGNFADDNVEDYDYDYIFDNDRPIEESILKFRELIKSLMATV